MPVTVDAEAAAITGVSDYLATRARPNSANRECGVFLVHQRETAACPVVLLIRPLHPARGINCGRTALTPSPQGQGPRTASNAIDDPNCRLGMPLCASRVRNAARGQLRCHLTRRQASAFHAATDVAGGWVPQQRVVRRPCISISNLGSDDGSAMAHTAIPSGCELCWATPLLCAQAMPADLRDRMLGAPGPWVSATPSARAAAGMSSPRLRSVSGCGRHLLPAALVIPAKTRQSSHTRKRSRRLDVDQYPQFLPWRMRR